MPKLVKKESKPTRTRMAPEVRMTMILDHAADLVAKEGVAALNMDRIGREAGISKSLVYAYFPSMQDLLQTLLKREYKHLRNLQNEAANSAETLEQMVRRITRAYLSYIEDRGLLLERLAAEPSVADHGDPTQYQRSDAVRFIAEIISKNLGIDLAVATPMVDISFGLPSAAGQYLIHNDISRQILEDITVTMILGSFEAIQSKYESSFKPLKR